MKRLHKLAQQRRRQMHVHMPPSGLQALPCGEPPGKTRPMPLAEPGSTSRLRALEHCINDKRHASQHTGVE
ncbi:hypothetical protein P0Y43_13780 [Pseudomonas entomophila]|uniref:hypothetical protein n=1 Tax=Pseudomonas entomophila TaxID=312306 RepID=UPI0023D7EACE|nr:hypothetical protein [Pseudomonas entomophila]MDF0731782.1 hypothetical protein [Pseudomonas entomophila]